MNKIRQNTPVFYQHPLLSCIIGEEQNITFFLLKGFI